MEINYYLKHNAQGTDESWHNCQFTSEADLSAFSAQPLVSINGQAYLRQHHVTYLTGKDTCRAHHFAKHLAIQLLNTPSDSSISCKVLWIDTLHSPHACASIYRELMDHAADKNQLHFVCLDVLGDQRNNIYWLNRQIEALVYQFKPQLVVIDDIDHFFPHCGISFATDFCHFIRDVTNHSHTAFLCIGYNHMGKNASTTGNIGKYLFPQADDVFALSTQRGLTTVRHVCGYDLHHDPDDTEFRFTIGSDNLPHKADSPANTTATPIDDATLQEIVSDIVTPGQDINPPDLIRQIYARHRQLRQQIRDTALLNQLCRLGLIDPAPTPVTCDAPQQSQ